MPNDSQVGGLSDGQVNTQAIDKAMLHILEG
jgi:hypothetical protein